MLLSTIELVTIGLYTYHVKNDCSKKVTTMNILSVNVCVINVGSCEIMKTPRSIILNNIVTVTYDFVIFLNICIKFIVLYTFKLDSIFPN